MKCNEKQARKGIVRSIAWTTPLFITGISLSIFTAILALDGRTSLWLTCGITSCISALSGGTAIAAWRDLFSEPRDTEGFINRKWTKSDVFIFRGHYIMVGKRIFRIRKNTYGAMPEEGQGIYLQHYPHTNTVVHWEKIKSPGVNLELSPSTTNDISQSEDDTSGK
uniref:Uncharacterized protein n=1 Tax=uncultured marine group II/III euryarchaeote AD1000_66_E09 TaxID=1457798 RepID=A0A075G168_9EURY|nr:hypothetical protein [uncultured marine group II/III euryarchaeote AD1000_66_E09]